jgi:hypothetical protein
MSRCCSADQSLRPSFDDILGEFQTNGFDIMPGADSAKIEQSVSAVLAWEADADSR